MKFKRCYISLLLSFCLLLSLPFSSFASSISTITNTVNYSGALIKLYYYTPQGNRRYVSAKVSTDGSFAFPRPSDLDMAENLVVSLSKVSLPSAGNYSFIADFALHTPMTYSRSYTWMLKNYNNVASQDAGTRDFSLVQNLGDFQISGVIELGYIDVIEFGASISGSVPSEIAGVIKVEFKKSSSAPQVVSPGAGTADQDVQSNISDNTGKMASEQEKTNGFLVEIIQTISNQLKSFWDQLAGEFTNLYNKMNQHHQEDLQKIDDQTSTITENDDKNTNILTSALEKLGNFLIDGLKGLFIPSDDFFQTYFDDLFSWFSDRLGFLSFPIDLLAQLVEMFLGSSSTDFIVTLPSFDIMGESLLQEASFNLTQFLNDNFGFVLNAIRLVVSVIMIFNFIKLCERKWEEVMMN